MIVLVVFLNIHSKFVEGEEVEMFQQDGIEFESAQKEELEIVLQDGIEIDLAQKVLQRLEVVLMAENFHVVFLKAGNFLQLEYVPVFQKDGVDDGLCLEILVGVMNVESLLLESELAR